MSEQLTENFARHEFACKCGCGFDAVDWQLVEALQELRDMTESVITITSGCRCTQHNIDVGGKRKTIYHEGSQHLYGKAADIKIKGHTPSEVHNTAAMILAFERGGIGKYDTFVHVDVRNTGRARWFG